MPAEIFSPSSPLVHRLLNSSEYRNSLISDGRRTKNQADDLMGDSDHVCRLLNDLFWASLHVDEGRPISGIVCICSPEESPRARKLLEPLEVSPKSLTALFTASPTNAVAVHLQDGLLCAWGFLDSLPIFTVRIRVVANGVLIASQDSEVIGILEKGEVTVTDSLHNTGLTLLIAAGLGNDEFSKRFKLAARIQSVAVAVHRHGHGGALVITPPADAGSTITDIDIAYRFDQIGTNSIRSALAEIAEAERGYAETESDEQLISADQSPMLLALLKSSVEAHQQLLRRLLTSVGNLSRIDGAVVIDTDLRVHGFGAKLSGEQDSITVTEMDALTRSTTQVSIAEIGGMRHQSAARYVYRNHDSLVIVASQDGKVTLFGWVVASSEVVAVRRLEHFCWEESSAD